MDEELIKSMDELIDEVFAEEGDLNKAKSSIDIAGDAKTTADAALSQAPGYQKDEARGAGRPKQISDVPQTDTDGKRAKEYDGDITENEGKENENDEAKKQAASIDQTTGGKGRMADAGASGAPKSRPFKKGEEISDEDWEAFQSFKKSQEVAAVKAEEEKLQKAEAEKKAEHEALLKSVVASAIKEATAPLQKENEELKKSVSEYGDLIKSMASQPQRAKSVTGIGTLEKGNDDSGEPEGEFFTKAQILDAATDLALQGKISDEVVSEIEMTGRVFKEEPRKLIESFMTQKR